MKHVRKRLTYANVMSSIAVFLILGGATAFAASELGKESVGTKQLKKEAVSLSKIKKGAKEALKGQTGPAGAAGKEGKAGSQGPQGAQGPRGLEGEEGVPGTAVAYATITSAGIVEASSGSFNLTNANVSHTAGTGVYCFSELPPGTDAVIAGYSNLFTGTNNDVIVSGSYDIRQPTPTLDGCPPEARARVRTFDVSLAALTDAPFNVWFEGS